MGYESACGKSVTLVLSCSDLEELEHPLVPMVHRLAQNQRIGISVYLVKFRQHSCQLWPFISMLKFLLAVY
jgi:hypothetical protein